MTQIHHKITGITIPVCIVTIEQLALCIATFAKLTIKVLKHIIYSNFVACSLQDMTFMLKYNIIVVTIHIGIIQIQNLTFHNQIYNLFKKGILAIYNTY